MKKDYATRRIEGWMSKKKIKKKTIDDYKKENIFLKAAIAKFCRDCAEVIRYQLRHPLTQEKRCEDYECALFEFCPFKKPLN